MNIKEYISRLRICKDSMLTKEFGIHDNWPILLGWDFNNLISYMRNFDMNEHKETCSNLENNSRRITHTFHYLMHETAAESNGIKSHEPNADSHNPNVILHARNWVPDICTLGLSGDETEAGREYEKSLHMYTNSIMLVNSSCDIEGIGWKRGFSSIIEDICMFALKKKIPICLPYSVGWDYINPIDYSRIALYIPDEAGRNQDI